MKAKKKEQLVGKKTVELKETIDLAIVEGRSFLGADDVINNGGFYTTTV